MSKVSTESGGGYNVTADNVIMVANGFFRRWNDDSAGGLGQIVRRNEPTEGRMYRPAYEDLDLHGRRQLPLTAEFTGREDEAGLWAPGFVLASLAVATALTAEEPPKVLPVVIKAAIAFSKTAVMSWSDATTAARHWQPAAVSVRPGFLEDAITVTPVPAAIGSEAVRFAGLLTEALEDKDSDATAVARFAHLALQEVFDPSADGVA